MPQYAIAASGTRAGRLEARETGLGPAGVKRLRSVPAGRDRKAGQSFSEYFGPPPPSGTCMAKEENAQVGKKGRQRSCCGRWKGVRGESRRRFRTHSPLDVLSRHLREGRGEHEWGETRALSARSARIVRRATPRGMCTLMEQVCSEGYKRRSARAAHFRSARLLTLQWMQFCELMTSLLPSASSSLPSASTYSYTAAGQTRPSRPAYCLTLVLTCATRADGSMWRWTGWSSAWYVLVRLTLSRMSCEERWGADQTRGRRRGKRVRAHEGEFAVRLRVLDLLELPVCASASVRHVTAREQAKRAQRTSRAESRRSPPRGGGTSKEHGP